VWQVEITDEFEAWFNALDLAEKASVIASVEVLEERGPALGRPLVDHIKGSRHPNMKELRTQSGGSPIRTFFAFDPRRAAILLIGGDKTGDGRFYERLIRIADDLYDEHLKELRKEGLI
jgi:hypothetical protein